jgi:hypothetical protein
MKWTGYIPGKLRVKQLFTDKKEKREYFDFD